MRPRDVNSVEAKIRTGAHNSLWRDSRNNRGWNRRRLRGAGQQGLLRSGGHRLAAIVGAFARGAIHSRAAIHGRSISSNRVQAAGVNPGEQGNDAQEYARTNHTSIILRLAAAQVNQNRAYCPPRMRRTMFWR